MGGAGDSMGRGAERAVWRRRGGGGAHRLVGLGATNARVVGHEHLERAPELALEAVENGGRRAAAGERRHAHLRATAQATGEVAAQRWRRGGEGSAVAEGAAQL